MAADVMTPAPRTVSASYRTDLVLSVLGVWFSIGLMLDAWAHNNVPGLESFFTPWHAVFYSGFAATAGWVLWTCRRALPDGSAGLRSVPAGYRPTVIAIGVFALAGVGDLVWHTAFGIEQALAILFSPTHLLLGAAMITIVTTPMRSQWADPSLGSAPGLRRLLPTVLGVAFATTLVMLFLQYANALTYPDWRDVIGSGGGQQLHAAHMAGSFAVSNVVVLLPLLTLARRWRLPPGTVTIIYLAVGGLAAAVTGLHNLAIIAAFLVAGVLVDVLALTLVPGPDRPGRYRLFAALASLITWTFVVATALLTVGGGPRTGSGAHPESGIELWTGLPIVQALIAWLLAMLLTPPASPILDRPQSTVSAPSG
jgi:hypothetical protein